MPAHLRDIHRPKCNRQGCEKDATVTLYNTWNAQIGDYCAKHGREQLADFERRHEGGA